MNRKFFEWFFDDDNDKDDLPSRLKQDAAKELKQKQSHLHKSSSSWPGFLYSFRKKQLFHTCSGHKIGFPLTNKCIRRLD